MKKRITVEKLIWTFIGMLILIWVLSILFKQLFLAIDVSESYATLLGLVIGFIVPGVGEFVNVILPFIKQFEKS